MLRFNGGSPATLPHGIDRVALPFQPFQIPVLIELPLPLVSDGIAAPTEFLAPLTDAYVTYSGLGVQYHMIGYPWYKSDRYPRLVQAGCWCSVTSSPERVLIPPRSVLQAASHVRSMIGSTAPARSRLVLGSGLA
jgi:hypothetical protein